jgi:hypothetical protein
MDSREFTAREHRCRMAATLGHLRELETQAKAARRGAWGKTQP